MRLVGQWTISAGMEPRAFSWRPYITWSRILRPRFGLFFAWLGFWVDINRW